MLSSMVSSLSGGYNEDATNDLIKRSWSSQQETDYSLEDMVPNGMSIFKNIPIFLPNLGELGLNPIREMYRSNCSHSRCASTHVLCS